jgi:hypothetical protein
MSPKAIFSPSHRLGSVVRTIFYCPTCSVWRLRPTKAGRAPPFRRKRYASTLASSTAINATKSVPPKLQNLHEALNELRKKAPGLVNLSRLQLAIQGLESEHPTIRVALLGLSVPATARRLARLFLVDASKPQTDWERKLLTEDPEQSPGLVIRFGNPHSEALQAARSMLPILHIPSPLLRTQGIEILTSSISAPDAVAKSTGGIPSDALLSPTVGTPASAAGRQSLISQPVHRTRIVAHGIDELLTIAELLARTNFGSESERRLVDVVLDLDGSAESADSRVTRFNSRKAEKGLQEIREALAKAPEFETAWTESGMPAMSKWLANFSAKSGAALSRPIRDLIVSLLEVATANIASQTREAGLTARTTALAAASRSSLELAIDAFSQQGHAELQKGLAAAWASQNWRKLAFWKLFWRVDDVPLIVTDLVTTAWLPRTERAVYELSGRLKQAGVPLVTYQEPIAFSEPQSSAVPTNDNGKEAPNFAATQPLILASSAATESVSTPLLPSTRIVTKPGPVPYSIPSLASAISSSRQRFITTAITTLTSSAQQIVLTAFTITGVSAALSALSFLSITSGSIYESATIVALGTAYALRRMQREWEVQCKDLEDGLMQEGRSVLRKTEEHMRRLVKDASRVIEDEVELRARKEADDAVQNAQAELSKLG